MIFDWFKRLFKRSKALESDSIDTQSLQSDNEALQNQSLQSASNNENKPFEIEKDSLHLGIAAGYTGRVLRDIESSLHRIETHMVTKDWMTMEVKDDLEKRLMVIQEALIGVSTLADNLPPQERTEVLEKIRTIESNLPLTPKMQQLLSILEETKEMSYEEMASKLNIQISALRGLLSSMSKRTHKVLRIEKNGKGWLKVAE